MGYIVFQRIKSSSYLVLCLVISVSSHRYAKELNRGTF